jgi:hypothetical protein
MTEERENGEELKTRTTLERKTESERKENDIKRWLNNSDPNNYPKQLQEATTSIVLLIKPNPKKLKKMFTMRISSKIIISVS